MKSSQGFVSQGKPMQLRFYTVIDPSRQSSVSEPGQPEPRATELRSAAALPPKGERPLEADREAVARMFETLLRAPLPAERDLEPGQLRENIRFLQDLLDKRLGRGGITVADIPSLRSLPNPVNRGALNDPPSLVVSFLADSLEAAQALDRVLRSREGVEGYRASLATDPLVTSLDQNWAPAFHGSLGRAADAFARVGWPAPVAQPLRGDGVDILIVDSGVDWQLAGVSATRQTTEVPSNDVTRGWAQTYLTVRHGSMIARILHRLAPRARLYSLAALPPPPNNGLAFLSPMDDMLQRFRSANLAADPARRWVVVHAWGLLDRRQDRGLMQFADDPTHPFHCGLSRFADPSDLPGNPRGADQVFAVGNCGDFSPDLRCGPYDIGSGQSVIGGASHPDVLSVGAVATDGVWIGLSSIGPGQERLGGNDPVRRAQARAKPDVAASSYFRDEKDAAWVSGGSSAACAVAAGIVACLRSNGSPHRDLTPGQMNALLRDTARRAPGQVNLPDTRRGSGILHLGDALAAAGCA